MVGTPPTPPDFFNNEYHNKKIVAKILHVPAGLEGSVKNEIVECDLIYESDFITFSR